MFKTKGIICEYYKTVGGAEENIGLCEDEGGHMAPCLLWLSEDAVCPTLLEQLKEETNGII